MEIDWFTFIAQIINFLVLVGLLRWLLYDRIVEAMTVREAKIAERMDQAKQAETEAQATIAEYEQKTQSIDRDRHLLLEQARTESQAEREQWLQSARDEVERRRTQWLESFRREQDEFLTGVRRQAGEAGLEAARQTLAQLADAELEQRMSRAFADRMKQMDGEVKSQIVSQLEEDANRVVVRSGFEMPSEERMRWRDLLRDSFQYEHSVTFERSDSLVCGLEFEVGGYTFDWNVDGFLNELEAEFADKLTENPLTP